MKIIIFGGTGTVGQIITNLLYENEITIFSRNENKQWSMKQKYPKCKNIVGDIRNKELVEKVLKDQHIVIHFAALKHISFCENNVDEAVDININGTKVIRDCFFFIFFLFDISVNKKASLSDLTLSSKCLNLILFYLPMTSRSRIQSIIKLGGFNPNRIT